MDSPRYTVIIPMAHYRATEPVLVSLRETPAPTGGLQIIVAEGRHPARQRNSALAVARGEIVFFFDNDCAINSGFWKELESAFSRPGVEIVGGPALLRPYATGWEEIFDALLTHMLVVGDGLLALHRAGRISSGNPDRPHPLQSRRAPLDLRENRPALHRPLSQ